MDTADDKKPIKDLLTEKDAFLTTSERLYEYFLRHTRELIVLGVAVAALVLGWAGYDSYRDAAEAKASAAYEAAVAATAQGPEAGIKAMEAVRADFTGRKAERLAAYALAALYAAQGDNDKALAVCEELMRALPAAEAAMKPVLLQNLAGLYETAKKYDEAAAAYGSLSEMGQPALRRDALMALARVKRAQGQTEEAVNDYQAVVNEFPNDVKAYMANGFLAALKGAPQAFPLGGAAAEEQPAGQGEPAGQSE